MRTIVLFAATIAVAAAFSGIEASEVAWSHELLSELKILNYTSDGQDLGKNSSPCPGMSSSKSDVKFFLCR